MTARRGQRGPRVGRSARAPLLGVVVLTACGATRGIILGEVADDAGNVDTAAVDAGALSVVLSGQSLTPQQGGTTETPYTDTCPGNQAVIGYQGFLTGPAV